MFAALFGSVEQGIIYAIMALGVYLSFRVLDFPDLTVDGSFVTGTSVAASMIILGYNPFLATLCAFLAGFFAGCLTGVLNTKGKINPLLSGILMMIALYSINLRIMGMTSEISVSRPNISLMNEGTIFTSFVELWNSFGIDQPINGMLSNMGIKYLPQTWGILFIMIIVMLVFKFFTDWLLQTEIGLAIRATGDNKKMIKSFSANTDYLIIFGIGLSNALVAFSGAIFAQYTKSSDIGMGVGMIIIGLASVIIGEAIFGTKTLFRTTLAVIVGAILYRLILGVALRVDILDTSDMKLITAVMVVLALVVPKIYEKHKEKKLKNKRHLERISVISQEGGGSNAKT